MKLTERALLPPKSLRKFIIEWEQHYKSPHLDELYFSNIRVNSTLKKENFLPLYQWKFGFRPNRKRDENLSKKAIANLEDINNIRRKQIDKISVSEVEEVAIGISSYLIAATYTMHIIKPALFPIFDKNVFRAFQFLTNGYFEDLENGLLFKKGKIVYLKYKNFFFKIKNLTNCDDRQIDRALFAFGQYIKNFYKR